MYQDIPNSKLPAPQPSHDGWTASFDEAAGGGGDEEVKVSTSDGSTPLAARHGDDLSTTPLDNADSGLEAAQESAKEGEPRVSSDEAKELVSARGQEDLRWMDDLFHAETGNNVSGNGSGAAASATSQDPSADNPGYHMSSLLDGLDRSATTGVQVDEEPVEGVMSVWHSSDAEFHELPPGQSSVEGASQEEEPEPDPRVHRASESRSGHGGGAGCAQGSSRPVDDLTGGWVLSAAVGTAAALVPHEAEEASRRAGVDDAAGGGLRETASQVDCAATEGSGVSGVTGASCPPEVGLG